MAHTLRPIPAKMLAVLKYDPASGAIIRIAGPRNAKLGCRMDAIGSHGYRRVRIWGYPYAAHRVAWFLHFKEQPPSLIDHINGDKSDNRITNLRSANYAQNKANSGLQRNNTSGFKGVTWNKASEGWQAQFKTNKKCHYLGIFDTPEEANAAYETALKHHLGTFERVF
jgi:hypothetical protein